MRGPARIRVSTLRGTVPVPSGSRVPSRQLRRGAAGRIRVIPVRSVFPPVRQPPRRPAVWRSQVESHRRQATRTTPRTAGPLRAAGAPVPRPPQAGRANRPHDHQNRREAPRWWSVPRWLPRLARNAWRGRFPAATSRDGPAPVQIRGRAPSVREPAAPGVRPCQGRLDPRRRGPSPAIARLEFSGPRPVRPAQPLPPATQRACASGRCQPLPASDRSQPHSHTDSGSLDRSGPPGPSTGTVRSATRDSARQARPRETDC